MIRTLANFTFAPLAAPFQRQSQAGPSYSFDPLLMAESRSPSPTPKFNIDNHDGTPTSWGPPPSLLPKRFEIPLCLTLCSDFYQALVAPHHFSPWKPRWKPSPARPGELERCAAMVQWNRDTESSADRVSQQALEESPSSSPHEDHTALIFEPHGSWAWASGLTIDDPCILKDLHNARMYRLRIKTGTIMRRQITYISKSWNVHRVCTGFNSELALYKSKDYLKPLQGDVIPHIIGVHASPEEINLAMALPHHSFWMEASSDMPAILKERCIAAYEKIHARGVLHGEPELRNMLIGADGRVTVINLHRARALVPDPEAQLEKAEEVDLRMEMRKVLYKLDYGDARRREEDKMNIAERRTSKNRSRQRRREWRAKGERVGYIRPDIPVPEDDILNPPLLREEWDMRWDNGKEHVPKRVVVPGQTEGEVAIEVQNLILSLTREDFEDQPSDDSAITTNVDEGPADHSPKRKAPSDCGSSPGPEDDRSPKRPRTTESSQTIDSRPSLPPTEETPEESQASGPLAREEPTPLESTQEQPTASSSTSPSPIKMWYSHLPEDAEVPLRPKRTAADLSEMEIKIRVANLNRCRLKKFPHRELVKHRLVRPTQTYMRRAERKLRPTVAFGSLKRQGEDERNPERVNVESKALREMYRELKEMKNRYIAGSVGTEEPVEGDDADWQAALYMGERLDVPEGPVILTRDAFERRQESQKEALVRYSRAPRGILKRPREEDGEQTAKSPSPSTLTEFGDDFEEPDIELTTLEQYRRLGIPPPRKKVRADGSSTSSDVTWLLQRVSNVTPRPLQKGDSPGLSSKDRAVSATCGDVMSPSRLQLGDGLDFTPPSLRALSFWRSTLMGMVNR